MQEETTNFTPKYDPNGLIGCITTSVHDNNVLMFAYMNEDALNKTLETGEMHYWSRSRNQLWHKGATSGHVQKLIEIRTDCDQDCLLAVVECAEDAESETACHTGRRSCFYRKINPDNKGNLAF